MQDEEHAPEEAAAALEEAADAMNAARQALNAKVVDAHRAGLTLSRIAHHVGLHPIAVRHLLAAAGEPLHPRWHHPSLRGSTAGYGEDSADSPSARSVGPQRAAAPTPSHSGAVLMVLLSRPDRIGGLFMLVRRP
jgi:hypothetical protein